MESTETRKCFECGGTMQGAFENYRYAECGLQSVVLRNILVFHCGCGAIYPEIAGLGELHQKIFLELISKDSRLTGEEMRFLRKMSGLTATELAKTMGVSKVSVSKWETGAKRPQVDKDKFMRAICFMRLLGEYFRQTQGPGADENLNKIDLRKFDITAVLKQVKGGDSESGEKTLIINNPVFRELEVTTLQ
jgi:DNA-binding transcriptional regulator YiaG